MEFDKKRPRSPKRPFEENKLKQDDFDCLLDEDQASKESTVLKDPTKYRLVKRLPIRPVARKNDIYVTRATKFSALVSRVFFLLRDLNMSEVYINAIGAAIERAVQVAIYVVSDKSAHFSKKGRGAVRPTSLGEFSWESIESELNELGMSINTGSTLLYDDYEPLKEGFEFVTRPRFASMIKIRIYRKQEKKF